MPPDRRPILDVRDLRKHFPVRGGLLARLAGRRPVVHAVNGVSFAIAPEETFGLVGESGCGKSTTGKLIARLLPPTAGSIRLDGDDWLALRGRALRRRRRDVQMIFQNPYLSVDPRWSVERIVAEPLAAHRVVPRAAMGQRVAALLEAVGLDPAAAQRYPHQFSGGQRQRIALARALAPDPRLLIADEPVSALDVSVQAQVLSLLQDVKRRYRLSMLFISHDLAVVRYVSDRVGVMYLGELVETGPTRELFRRPLHPYTVALLAASPRPTAGARRARVPLRGEIPSPIDLPDGCPFRTRCPRAEPRCVAEKPALHELLPGRWAACHFPEPGPQG